MNIYNTNKGRALCGDSLELLGGLESASVDLIITSPPFALQRQKQYGDPYKGNGERSDKLYLDWLLGFTGEIKRVLKDSGSFVIDLGGAYQKKRPVRSLYNYRYLISMCDDYGMNLAEEFFWYNPAKLPSPIEWVNKRKIRAKDSVNTVWWFSKTDFPKADVGKVRVPYSDRMKKLLEDPDKFYKPTKRPSNHGISKGFGEDKGGALPSNLLQVPNTGSNSTYAKRCKLVGAPVHPARFPEPIPKFFIDMLTDEGDVVVDIFAGSNTTGKVAESLGREWVAMEKDLQYSASSVFRFVDDVQRPDELERIYQQLLKGEGYSVEQSQSALL